MKLSQMERLILVNQYMILEKLYPEEASSYAQIRNALEDGYELEYSEIFNNICHDDEVLNEDGCMMVRDILNMFSALKRSYNKLEDKSGINAKDVALWGFAGNDETEYMAYARYLIEKRQLWGDLQEDAVFNRHMPSLSRYRQMLNVWNSFGDGKYELTKEQILSIIEP